MLGRTNEFDGGKNKVIIYIYLLKGSLFYYQKYSWYEKKKGNDSGNDGGGWSK